MASIEVLAAFLLTTFTFAFVPGPSMLYAAARTLSNGRLAGLMAALGIHIGCYAHILAAAAGLSYLFHAVPVLYASVKLAGAAYLVWMGISLFRSRPGATPEVVQRDASQAMVQSILVEVLNPKTAIFYLAFLPQFIDLTGQVPVALQFLVLGTAVNIIFTVADLMCVLLASTLARSLGRSGAAQRLLRRTGGAVLVGMGVHLALKRG